MRVSIHRRVIMRLLVSFAALVAMACGGRSRSLPVSTSPVPAAVEQPVPEVPAVPSPEGIVRDMEPAGSTPPCWHRGSSASFGELVLTAYYPEGRNPGSYLRGFRLAERADGGCCYDLVATCDLGKRSVLLYEIGFPASRMHPVEVSFAPRYQSAEVLTFTALEVEGVLPLGVIKLDAVSEDLQGEQLIATVRFASGAVLRSTSKVPTGPLNKAELQAGASEGATIAWDEKNCADTNNDGVVSIADITPIAAYFTQSASASAGAEMADTNKDTVVSIADLTNIAAFYSAELSGYAIYRVIAMSPVEAEAALTAIPDSSPYDSVDRPQGLSGPPRSHYAYTDPEVSPNAYYQVAPRNPGEFGVRSNTVLGSVPGPEVAITTPTDGTETSEMLIHVAATIDSLNAIAEVRFSVSGQAEPFATLTEAPWEADLDTAEMADGSHDITVVAEDSYHQTGSDSVSVTLTGHNPVVTWISPSEGEQVANELNISLDVSALAAITAVEVFLDAEADPLVTFGAAPYETVVDASGFAGGAHTLSAIATDELDRTGSADRGFTQLGVSIEITSPSDGETIWGDQVSVTVETDAPAGSAVDILFEDWPDPLASKSEAPYEFTIRAFDLPAGTHALRARVEVATIVREDSVSVEIPTTFEQAVLSMGKQVGDLNFSYYGSISGTDAPERANPPEYGGLLPEYNSYWRDDHSYMPEWAESIATDYHDSADSMVEVIQWGGERLGYSESCPAFIPTEYPSEPLANAVIALMTEIGDPVDESAIRNDASEVPLGLQTELACLIDYLGEAREYREQYVGGLGIDDELAENYAGHHGLFYSQDPASWGYGVPTLAYLQISAVYTANPFADALSAGMLCARGVEEFVGAVEPGDYPGPYDFSVDTSIGRIVVNDPGIHSYDNRDYLLIVDVGGGDAYTAPAGANNSVSNGVSVCVDLGGDDVYNGIDDPFDINRTINTPSNDDTSQYGVGRLGVGILADVGGGNDHYESVRVSMGFGILGVGILYDDGGNDSYDLEAMGQGAGLRGMGLLMDMGGSDDYYAVHKAQGYGAWQGVGVLYDNGGSGNQITAEPELDSRMPEYVSAQDNSKNANFCQGSGFGLRGALGGGLGMLLSDGEGTTTYTGAIFSTAASYYYATGVLYDAGGDDIYVGDWYALSGNAHQAACILIDKGGNDSYTAQRSVGVGGGHDVSVGWLVDCAGNDIYNGSGYTLGGSNQCGAGYFVDVSGDDTYDSQNEKLALGRGHFGNELVNDVWDMHLCRLTNYFNWAVFIDGGGNDTYAAKYASIETLDPAEDTNLIYVTAGNGLTWIRAMHGNGTEHPGDPPPDNSSNSYWANEYGIGVDADGGTPL